MLQEIFDFFSSAKQLLQFQQKLVKIKLKFGRLDFQPLNPLMFSVSEVFVVPYTNSVE